MNNRKTFFQLRQSRTPQVLGACANDIPKLASYVNEATERLVKEASETGWYGTWQRTVFAVDPADPYITLPRSIARIINLDVCRQPVRIRNEFYEFMEAGIGLQPVTACNCNTPCNQLETFDRGFFPTFRDLTGTGNPKLLRVYPTSARDISSGGAGGRRILLQGLDNNSHTIRSLDNGFDIDGEYLTLETPFTTSLNYFSTITGVQKEVTAGDVLLYEVDSVTGTQTLLSRYETVEINPSYRRYLINGMPTGCCDALTTTQVTCMAKLEFLPVSRDQDWLLIPNIPALKLECEAIRYEEMDNDKAQVMAARKHRQAVKFLNDELAHYVGRLTPIVNFSPFGTATLDRVSINMI